VSWSRLFRLFSALGSTRAGIAVCSLLAFRRRHQDWLLSSWCLRPAHSSEMRQHGRRTLGMVAPTHCPSQPRPEKTKPPTGRPRRMPRLFRHREARFCGRRHTYSAAHSEARFCFTCNPGKRLFEVGADKDAALARNPGFGILASTTHSSSGSKTGNRTEQDGSNDEQTEAAAWPGHDKTSELRWMVAGVTDQWRPLDCLSPPRIRLVVC
jgi:hypothetical protein